MDLEILFAQFDEKAKTRDAALITEAFVSFSSKALVIGTNNLGDTKCASVPGDYTFAQLLRLLCTDLISARSAFAVKVGRASIEQILTEALGNK